MTSKSSYSLKLLQISCDCTLIAASLAAFQRVLPLSYNFFTHSAPSISHILNAAAILGAVATCLAVRRSFRQSSHSPLEPPVAKSWFPWIGHAIEIVRHGPAAFLQSYSSRYGTAFKFEVFGRSIVAISSPTAVCNFLRDRTSPFDVVGLQVIEALSGVKVPRKRLAYFYKVLEQTAVIAVGRGLSQRRLHQVYGSFSSHLLEQMNQTPLSTPLSLRNFVHRHLYNSVSFALFGPHFPLESFDAFQVYEKGTPMLFLHLPILAREATAAREQVYDACSRYVKRCWHDENGGYLEGASEAMSEMVRFVKSSELSEDEVIRLFTALLWGVHSNVMGVAMWLMCHILTDKDVATRIRKDIRAVVDERYPDLKAIANMNPKALDDPEFAFLTSVTQEVLRTKLIPTSVREALEDTTIMGDNGETILIRKGEFVVADIRSMHFSPDLQTAPELFKADRYLESQPYKSFAFGSGKHICAGRHWAMYTMRMFIVLSFSLFDIDLVPDTPGSPVSLPKEDMRSIVTQLRPTGDLSITMQRRRE